jgi:hypothetical protein
MVPRLGCRASARGVGEEHVPAPVAASRGSSMRANPIALTDGEVGEILRRRL